MGVLNCNFCDNICCNILCYRCRDHYICDSCLLVYKKNLSEYIDNNELHEKISRHSPNYSQEDDYMCKNCINLIVSKTELIDFKE
jgi:hypothetical protein